MNELALYNEIDDFAADWLENLIRAELIAPGVVDRRSIVDLTPDDVAGFRQVHFFAGIGGWSYALRLAGWPDDRPVWTGSCPCQPYSVASVAHGGAKGQGDERDHWPSMFRLIRERAPATIFGEQVGSAITWGWWDRAALDLEGEAFSCAASVLRADASGAKHERKRLYWVAHASRERRQGYQPIKRLPFTASKAFAVNGDPLARARRALDGDLDGLLHCDGLSVVMERHALKGFGNAIIPRVAAQFILAAQEAIGDLR